MSSRADRDRSRRQATARGFHIRGYIVEKIVVGIRSAPRKRPHNRAVWVAALGAMLGFLGMLGFWMVDAFSRVDTPVRSTPTPLAAVQEKTDWTGGLARQIDEKRSAQVAKADEPIARKGADEPSPRKPADEPGVKKVTPTAPPTTSADAEPKREGAEGTTTKSDRSGSTVITTAQPLIEAGKYVEARKLLNDALTNEKSPSIKAELRQLLATVADKTIFSDRQIAGDPLIDIYTLQNGDNLVNVARRHDVPSEVIALVNALKNPDNVPAGKTIKIPKGPFHATVVQSEFRIDLYLQDTYVRSYPVGLGKEKRTPNGVWKVVDRIPNPTYYPSESAEHKEVVAGGDPKNPLGLYWLKLEGVEGDTVGQVGYGIHGTNQPDSIGKNESLGCVRMRNEDVAIVFKLMRPGKSTVRTVP